MGACRSGGASLKSSPRQPEREGPPVLDFNSTAKDPSSCWLDHPLTKPHALAVVAT